MFEFIGKHIPGKNKGDGKCDKEDIQPFTFGHKEFDSYQYPNLYEEADEMLQASMLIYSITDLRTLAKDPKKKEKLKSPEKILDLPLNLKTCLQVLDDNYDAIKECLGEADHINTINYLNLIHARFQNHRELTSSSSGSSVGKIFATITHSDRDVEVEQISPVVTYFGDENPTTDMVYAVGMDQIRKRITIAFRGSVTPTDFQKDAMITLNQQSNPVINIDSNQRKTFGIHSGFYDYLLRPRKNGMNKYQEIMGHVEALFLEYDRRRNYKLYVTGHSLGGALATLFSLHAASSAGSDDGVIPSPVCCVSVASPRVGDREFQTAFCRLEELGHLRHLRIANDRDPVTTMPSATGKKVWARLSPISYMAFKLMDNKFEENQNFCHTGVKLRLAKNKWELAFLGTPMINSECDEAVEASTDVVLRHGGSSASLIGSSTDRNGSSTSVGSMLSRSTNSKSNSTRQSSFRQSQVPDVAQHMGDAYTMNLGSVKNGLLGLSLNDVYEEKAVLIFLEKTLDT